MFIVYEQYRNATSTYTVSCIGCPEASRVLSWYGGLEDVRRGTCPLTRWEVFNLARVWLDPRLQREDVKGTFLHPQR
jgi:hypothetical protein